MQRLILRWLCELPGGLLPPVEEERLTMLGQQAVSCPVFSSKLVIYVTYSGLVNPNISIFNVPLIVTRDSLSSYLFWEGLIFPSRSLRLRPCLFLLFKIFHFFSLKFDSF